MKLLYFVQYFPPENTSGLSVIVDMLHGFAEYGWEVEVFVPTPTRGVSSDVRREYVKKKKEVYHDGKLIIHRMSLYREGTHMLQRSIRYSIFSLQCLIKCLFVDADAMFTGGGPPTQGIVVGLAHKLTKKIVIFNPQDLFPDSLIFSGSISENSFIAKLGRKMERFSYRNSDVIITISDDMKRTIASRCEDNKKVNVVRNWIDINKTVPIARNENKLFDEFGIARDKFCVVYAGNIGHLQGIDTIIDAAQKLKENNRIQFVIFGNGSEEEIIKKRVQNEEIDNVKIFPLQSQSRVSEVYSMGDVCIISCKAGIGNAGMPSKTWTIMATGRCIVGSFDTDSELARTLKNADCGVCVSPGDAEQLAEVISKFSIDDMEVSRMGDNARRYAVDYASKEQGVKKYITIIEATMKKGRKK